MSDRQNALDPNGLATRREVLAAWREEQNGR